MTRRRSVSTQELKELREQLEVDYVLRDYEVDAGPKLLKVSGPKALSQGGFLLKDARAETQESRHASKELLHGRDGLSPAPESSHLNPNWGDLWPSARAMASYFGHQVRMRSVDAVEVNCGLGVAGLGAAAKGGRVTLLDSNPEAIRFARYNALQNGFTHIHTREFDWKHDVLEGQVGSLIFADVLHDAANFERVFKMLRDNLSPGRTAFLAEPGRPIATVFFDELRTLDYHIRLDIERVPDPFDENYYLVHVLRIKKEE